MVIERFSSDALEAVGERFRACGRMLPDGVSYITSWLTPEGDTCYQIMDAKSRQHLDPWLACWSDLVDFEVRQIVTSAEFWKSRDRTS